jgi:hypothetical protein
MAGELSLICWILGLGNQNCVVVDIPPSKYVDHLKDTIKKKKENAFSNIDADQLEISKVNDPAQRTRHY